ncbi:sugar phosphate isomerase/epimerase family protein [Rhizorhabdus sp.]|uniref:sugar phosphate isomerase/epimerase family protein n=1 Tax=Rhizorhabdus sp. TaxID=1968843 RepID=UPI0035B13706
MISRLSLAPLSLPDLTPDVFLRTAADAGYRRVCLRLFGGDAVRPRLLSPTLVDDPVMAVELGRIADGEGVAITEIEVLMIGRNSDIASCEPMLAEGAAIGARVLTVCVVDEDIGRATDRIGTLARLAGGYRIEIGLEFAPSTRMRSLGEAVALRAQAGESNVSVVVDALHLTRSGGRAADVAAACEAPLRLLQLCDAPLVAPEDPADRLREARDFRLVPGEGEIDLVSLIRAMPEGCAFSVEVPDAQRVARLGPVGHARRLREAAERLFAEVK